MFYAQIQRKVNRSLSVICCLAVLCSNAVFSQENLPNSDKPVFVPRAENLTNDWWTYIDQAGDQLQERIDSLNKEIQSNISIAEISNRESHQNTAQEIAQFLKLFSELKNLTSLPLQELPSEEEKYTLEKYLALASMLRDERLELDIETEELAVRKSDLEKLEKQIDNLKVRYADMDAGNPLRLEVGLNIILGRSKLALATEEFRLLKPHLSSKQSRIKELQNRLRTSSPRIDAGPEDIKRFRQAVIDAEILIKQLSNERNVLTLHGSGLPKTSKDQLANRLKKQKLINLDVLIGTAELRLAQANAAASFTEHVVASDERSTVPVLRENLESLKQKIIKADELRQTRRRATDKERQQAENQYSIIKEEDAGFSDINLERIKIAEQTLRNLAKLREQLASSETLLVLASERLAEDEGIISSITSKGISYFKNAWMVTSSLLNGSLFSINDTPVTLLGLFRLFLIIGVAWWVSKIARHGLERVSKNSDVMNRASLYTVGRLFHYVILIFGTLIGLSSIGLDFTKLAIFVSALGVGLGFGLQAIFSNFVAGLIILFEKSLKVTDFVELESGVTGEVKEINIRSTLITTNDNIDILVPNSEFVSGRVINWTLREAYRRLRVPFGVAYGTDKELVKKAALEAANAVPFTHTGQFDRLPRVWLVEFGDSSLNFELVVWLIPEAVNRPGAVQAAYTWELETALAKHGIEIPFPQRDLHIRSGFQQ